MAAHPELEISCTEVEVDYYLAIRFSERSRYYTESHVINFRFDPKHLDLITRLADRIDESFVSRQGIGRCKVVRYTKESINFLAHVDVHTHFKELYNEDYDISNISDILDCTDCCKRRNIARDIVELWSQYDDFARCDNFALRCDIRREKEKRKREEKREKEEKGIRAIQVTPEYSSDRSIEFIRCPNNILIIPPNRLSPNRLSPKVLGVLNEDRTIRPLTDEEIEWLAELKCVSDWIKVLPKGTHIDNLNADGTLRTVST